MKDAAAQRVVLHASCVSVSGLGVLILGASGSGKSGLALQLMALGCDLVADDRTALVARRGVILATAPLSIRGLIEARGVGILNATPAAAARIILAVDLDQTEQERLPPHRQGAILGTPVPVLHRIESTHFPAAIVQYLRAGRSA